MNIGVYILRLIISFIGEYADSLLMIMRQVISERACLMFL